MSKNSGYNKFANTAIIAGIILIAASIAAVIWVNGDSLLQQIIAEFRSEVAGVGVGILVVGSVAKYFGVKLG